MKIKIKQITLLLFLVNAIFILVNIKYKDEIVSVIPDLDYAKLFFYLGFISFIIYLIRGKLKKTLTFILIITIISFCFSMFFNLRLAKDNYNRIQCNKGMSEYYKYFEFKSCEKIQKRFEEDLINGELKYFQNKYNSALEFEERLKDEYGIELIGINCTQFTSMKCYNNLIKDYIKKR